MCQFNTGCPGIESEFDGFLYPCTPETGCPSGPARSVELRPLTDSVVFGAFYFDGVKYKGARRFKKFDEAEQSRIDFIETGIIWD